MLVCNLSLISSAALLVKVMATICHGLTLWVCKRWEIRAVRTLVLPDPGPAMTLVAPKGAVTALICSSLREAKMFDGVWGGCSGDEVGVGGGEKEEVEARHVSQGEEEERWW
jgi:hypothetical protein